ncbi:MAG: hypothetical protein ACRENG_26900 [bacterium]
MAGQGFEGCFVEHLRLFIKWQGMALCSVDSKSNLDATAKPLQELFIDEV